MKGDERPIPSHLGSCASARNNTQTPTVSGQISGHNCQIREYLVNVHCTDITSKHFLNVTWSTVFPLVNDAHTHTPGQMQLQRMPLSTKSAAIPFVNPITAALVALYTHLLGAPYRGGRRDGEREGVRGRRVGGGMGRERERGRRRGVGGGGETGRERGRERGEEGDGWEEEERE